MELAKTPAEERFGGSWKIIFPFFILPLLIVSFSVGVFFLFSRWLSKPRSASVYLEQLHSTSSHKRWQAAFELSRFFSKNDVPLQEKQSYENHLLETYKHVSPKDTEFNRYLIVALSQVGSEKTATLFLEQLSTPDDETNHVFRIWGLGRLKFAPAIPTLTQNLSSSDPGLRKASAFSIGFMEDPKMIPTLIPLLNDPILDVRLNTALALAQLGSAAGESQLLNLLDLKTFTEQTPHLRTPEREEMVLSAVNAVGKLTLKSAKPKLNELLKQTQNERLKLTIQNTLSLL